ncbi:iron ABC transporter permease, partial [Leucobacter sp. OLES1]
MIPSVRESGEALGSRRSATGRTAALLLGAAVVLGAAAVLGLGLGSHRIDPATVVAAFVAYDPTDDAHLIVVQSRLPRIVLGIAVGAALGLAGALMQSVTRNPLADPGILGVNAGASLLVVLAI